ncbi:MAG: AAA family ATPase [Pseudomonadota bacterium]
MNDRFTLITGCSGGGKSTLLKALSERGFATVPEPGRRIVTEELAGDGTALPWVDMRAFARRAVEMAISDFENAHHLEALVFFDRGLIDAAIALEHASGQSVRDTLGDHRPYATSVFVVPPWEEIFASDTERRHDFGEAVQEYHRITRTLDALGYRQHLLPRVSVSSRVDMVLNECKLR